MSTLSSTSIGASEIAAVLGLSPWASPYEIWARKTGRIESHKSSDAIDAGKRLERVVLDWAEDVLGPIRREIEAPIDGTPILTHPDGITHDGRPVEAKTSGIAGPLYGEWGEPETDQIPDYYLVQALMQIAATEADLCFVPALLGGRGFSLYRVPANKALQREIIERVCTWWDRHVVRDEPPEMTAPPPLSIMKRLRREPGKSVDLDPGLVETWLSAKERAKQAAKEEEEAQAAVLAALGDAEAGTLPDGREVTYFEQFRKGYVVEECRFRVLRVRKGGKR